MYVLLGILIVPACTDLEVDEVDSIVVSGSDGGFTAGDPAALLEALYTADMGALTDQNNTYALFTHTSDELIPPTRGVDWSDNGVWRTLHAHTWDPTHASIRDAWNQLNERSFKTNQVLASNPNAQQAAEAKFLRAFFMWQVMDLFGQVPFREVDEGVNVDPRVFTRAEAFDFIINDLTEALPDLPETGPSPTNTKASKAAANTLLARLYLNKAVYTSTDISESGEIIFTFDNADMQKVIEHADAVTAAGYALEDEYFSNFTPLADSEIIFATSGGTPQNRWMMTLHYNQNPSGWNGFTTLADFYNKFEDGDVRKGVSATPDGSEFSGIGKGFLIGQQYNDDGEMIIDDRTQIPLSFTPEVRLSGAPTGTGIRAIKYHPDDHGLYIFFRYADVFLMKAEALMRMGNSGEALTMVNELRATRGASALGSLDDAALLDERGRELYWEGIRRTDQVRFGTFTTTWHEKTVTDPFRVLFPIPQQAIDSNPNLVQNPGY